MNLVCTTLALFIECGTHVSYVHTKNFDVMHTICALLIWDRSISISISIEIEIEMYYNNMAQQFQIK